MHLFIVGCGYVGSALVAGARAVWGDALEVSALRRHVAGLPAGVRPVAADLSGAAQLPPLSTSPIDAVVFCAAPGDSQQASYEAVYIGGTERVLQKLSSEGHRPRRVIFVSSTGVYAQDDGAVVDETSATVPTRYQGQVMLRAEAAARSAGWPACVLRCGGIYGPGRDGLIRRLRAQTASWPQGVHYTNRIHRDDCVGMIVHILQRDDIAPVYNGVDDASADQNDVLRFLADRMRLPLPSPAAQANRVTGKQVSNALLRAHGYTCRFPTYQAGYEAILRAEAGA